MKAAVFLLRSQSLSSPSFCIDDLWVVDDTYAGDTECKLEHWEANR